MALLKTIWNKNKKDVEFKALTDDIVGGSSKSEISISDIGEVIFSGEIFPRINGTGYSAFKTSLLGFEKPQDYDGVFVKIMGDGKKYRFVIRTTFKENSIYFHCPFITKPHEWQTHYISFGEFSAYYKEMKIPALKINKTKMKSMGIMISDDQYGHFHMAMSDIGFYKGKIERVSSNKLYR